jgi:7-cyano-7-deazaguanine synthase in queuosine biosynthesis
LSNLKLVLWSGGCDSTLALYEALVDQKLWVVEGKTRSEVRAVSVTVPQVPCNAQQSAARVALLASFADRNLTTRHIEVKVANVGEGPRRGKDGGSIQTQMWLGAVAPFMDDAEDLIIGWHEGEFDNVADAEQAFNALQRLNGKDGKLAFPLRSRSKLSVVAKLRKLELLDLCWWCEGSGDDFRADTTPCGNCKKCIAHETVLWQLDHFHKDVLELNGMLE